MFAIPIAAIVLCIYFVIHLIDIHQSSAKQMELDRRKELYDHFLELVTGYPSKTAQNEIIYDATHGWKNGREAFDTFIGNGEVKWGRFYSAKTYELFKMAQHGKYPRSILSCTRFSPDPLDRNGYDEEFAEMSERFMLRIADELNKHYNKLNVYVYVNTPLPPSYIGKPEGDSRDYRLDDFISRYGYGKTSKRASFGLAVVRLHGDWAPLS